MAIAPPEEGRDHFVYRGRVGEVIPRDVTRVKIHLSVRVIKNWAFSGCSKLTSVTLGDGVRVIKREAFRDCRGLTSVTLGDGLEKIGVGAFLRCTSLQDI